MSVMMINFPGVKINEIYYFCEKLIDYFGSYVLVEKKEEDSVRIYSMDRELIGTAVRVKKSA